MAESSLSLGYNDFFTEVSYYLGYGRVGYSTLNASDSAKAAHVDFIVQSGLRKFYNPPQIKRVVAQTENAGPILRSEARAHTWSFLRYTGTVTLLNATATYDLPDNFGGELSELTTATGAARVPVGKEEQVRSASVMSPVTGLPQYVAVRPKTSASTTGQRFEMIMWPTPGASQANLVFTYRYKKLPNKIDTTNLYPEGGLLHGQTIMAACLAVAESQSNDGGNGLKAAEYQTLLESSIEIDLREQGQDVMIAPATLIGAETNFDWLMYEIGEFMGWGGNSVTWTSDQAKRAQAILREGIDMFRYPADPLGGHHTWSFLVDELTVSLVDGTDTYDITTAFSSPVGDAMLVSTNAYWTRVSWVPETRINELSQAYGTTSPAEGEPEIVCFRPKPGHSGTASQLYQIRVFPVPDASYTLKVRYYVAPEEMTSSAKFSRGGKQFGLTLLRAVLSAAEMKRDGRTGPQRAEFEKEIRAAIIRDRVEMTPAIVGNQPSSLEGADLHELQKALYSRTATFDLSGITS